MSERTVDGAVADAARAAMVCLRRDEHGLLEQVVALEAAGVVAVSGYRSLPRLLEDLWTIRPARARRLVTRAALSGPRTSMTGQVLCPVLPATAAASAAGRPLLADGPTDLRI